MDYPTMSEDQVEEILENNPDISADYTKRKRHEKALHANTPTEWKRAILLGLLVGLLWVIAICGLVSGFTLTMVGAAHENMGQLIGGLILLAVGVAFTICAKIFHEKVKYGEV